MSMSASKNMVRPTSLSGTSNAMSSVPNTITFKSNYETYLNGLADSTETRIKKVEFEDTKRTLVELAKNKIAILRAGE